MESMQDDAARRRDLRITEVHKAQLTQQVQERITTRIAAFDFPVHQAGTIHTIRLGSKGSACKELVTEIMNELRPYLEVNAAAHALTHIKTDELQCILEHWNDGTCTQEAADSLAAYNYLVSVINQES